MPVSAERKKYLREKFKYAAKSFGKAGTRSDYPTVPKEQQLSIDLDNKKFFDVIGKILHWIENTFKYFFQRYNLFTEVGTKERKVFGTNTEVKYFITDEQTRHTLYIGEENRELRLYNLEGKLYDTSDKTSKGKKGCVAYVITLDGRLIVHAHINVGLQKYAYRHSTLAGGEPVLCSGLMKVVKGKITYIDNNSGHYKPEQANLYNAVKKLHNDNLFSQDAKIACLGHWNLLMKEVPFMRQIPSKKELVKKFLERMEKRGADGPTKYERYFAQVKEYNDQYRQQLFLSSYKPVPILDNTNPKIAVEHSIRKIIGASYRHKPVIDLEYNKEKVVGVNITFSSEDDSKRFARILDFKKCPYRLTDSEHNRTEVNTLLRLSPNEKDRTFVEKLICNKTFFVEEKNINKFINNTLQINIDSIESLNQQKNRKSSGISGGG